MNKKIVAFGDVHLHWQSMRLILDYAREQRIDTALTLGDEAHKIYPFAIGEQEEYDRMWHELRIYRDEKEGRELICCLGDKTAGVARDLMPHFVGVGKSGKITRSVIYKNGNILAAHNGQWILDKYRKGIEKYSGLEPLVIFHGHSHSMGVLPEYKWLKYHELVDWLKNGEEQHILEPGKVYWVNPGGQFIRTNDGRMAANFATYNSIERLVNLRTILYNEKDIRPSPMLQRRK